MKHRTTIEQFTVNNEEDAFWMCIMTYRTAIEQFAVNNEEDVYNEAQKNNRTVHYQE